MTSLPRTPLQRRLLVAIGLVAAFALMGRLVDLFTTPHHHDVTVHIDAPAPPAIPAHPAFPGPPPPPPAPPPPPPPPPPPAPFR